MSNQAIEGAFSCAGLPEYLYTYRDVTSEFTVKQIVNRELFFAPASTLNDPLDTTASFRLRSEATGLDPLLAYIVDTNGTENADTVTDMLRDPRVRDNFERGQLQQVNETARASVGVCCFSEHRDNILMWSHYAKNHRGICIEYDTFNLPTEHKWRFGKVDYSRNYPIVHSPLSQSDSYKLVYTKAMDWAYEREWRARNAPDSRITIREEAISGIILGCMATEEEEVTVRGWLEARTAPVKLMRAERNPDTYGLTIRDIVK